MPKIALLQMTSGIDPDANTRTLVEAIGQAAEQGATMLFTPEMSGLLDRDRKRAAAEVEKLEQALDKVKKEEVRPTATPPREATAAARDEKR